VRPARDRSSVPEPARDVLSWFVHDDGGDLTSVLSLTDDTTGQTESTTSISVSDTDASATTSSKARKDDGLGHTDAVSLTVSNSNGETATDSATIPEDGL